MKMKLICAAAALSLLLTSLTACGTGDAETSAHTGKPDRASGTSTEMNTDAFAPPTDGAAQNADTSTEPGSAGATADDTDKSENAATADDLFTNRDRDPSYDEASAVQIALADGATTGGAGVTVDGDTVTITGEGVYVLTGTLTNGQVIVDADKSAKLQLVLAGASVTNSSGAALYIRSADKVFVTLADGTSNTLVSSGAFVQTDDNNVDGAIYSKEDLTINGGGSLTVNSAQGHGIVGKDSVVVTGGSVTITAAKHGVQAKDDFRMLDGALTITSGKDGVHAANDDDESLGYIYLAGGSLTVNSEDDGIHAENVLTIEGGTIDIQKSYEGLEAKKITIDGGNIRVVASDDGVNAAGGAGGQGFGFFGGGGMNGGSSDYVLTVNGGTLSVNAGGDGVDSNGVMLITGGAVYVSGPTNAGNGAVDYEMEGVITGGTVIATGAAGMAQNFGQSSTQGTMLLSVSGSAGEPITVTDENGTVLASYTAEKAFQTAVISAPGIAAGGTYTVTVGGEARTVQMTSTVYSEGGMGGMGGPGGPGGMGGRR